MKSSLPADPGKRLALLVKQKRLRDGIGVNQAAKACGVCASTISRIEHLKLPNLPDGKTLLKLGQWLGVPVSQLLGDVGVIRSDASPLGASPPEVLEVHLRADKKLTPEAAAALSKMFQVLYEQTLISKKPNCVWIEAKAKELRNLAGTPPGGVLDIFRVAECLDAEISELTWGDGMPDAVVEYLLEKYPSAFSAGALRTPQGFLIVVNSAHHTTRKRISVMEECAHIFLDHQPMEIPVGNAQSFVRKYDEAMEQEAYAVGAAALLPPEVIWPVIRQEKSKRSLAIEHDVSEALIEYRIRQIRLD